MSLVDPKNPCRWKDGTPRSCANGFCLGFTGEPIDWKPLQQYANARRTSTANVDRARKTGKDLSTMHGISKRADTRIAAQAPRKAGR